MIDFVSFVFFASECGIGGEVVAVRRRIDKRGSEED